RKLSDGKKRCANFRLEFVTFRPFSFATNNWAVFGQTLATVRHRCDRRWDTAVRDDRYTKVQEVLTQQRRTSATLQPWAMQPPARWGSRASNTSLMVPIPASSSCSGNRSSNLRAPDLSDGWIFIQASIKGPI